MISPAKCNASRADWQALSAVLAATPQNRRPKVRFTAPSPTRIRAAMRMAWIRTTSRSSREVGSTRIRTIQAECRVGPCIGMKF